MATVSRHRRSLAHEQMQARSGYHTTADGTKYVYYLRDGLHPRVDVYLWGQGHPVWRLEVRMRENEDAAEFRTDERSFGEIEEAIEWKHDTESRP